MPMRIFDNNRCFSAIDVNIQKYFELFSGPDHVHDSLIETLRIRTRLLSAAFLVFFGLIQVHKSLEAFIV